MNKLKYIFMVILFSLLLIPKVYASSIYDLVGKSYDGCEIIDVVYIEEPSNHYMISCIKLNSKNKYELLRYNLYYSKYNIEDNLHIKDVIHLLK